jgi:hypothetical protein
MINATSHNFPSRKFFSALAAACFLFLLISSAPHRVHHLFEPDAENTCITLTLAKGCHFQLPSTIELAVTFVALNETLLSFEIWIPYLSASPFSPRAPPKA